MQKIKRILVFGVFIWFFPFVIKASEELFVGIEKDECISIDECINKFNNLIEVIPEDDFSYNLKVYAIESRLLDFDQDKVVARVIPFLKSPNYRTKYLASTVLSNVEEIGDAYFFDLVDVIENNDDERFKSGLFSTLAKIKSERAAEYAVDKFLHSDGKSFYQAQALRNLGDRVLPYMDKLLDEVDRLSYVVNGDVAPTLVAQKLIEQAFDDNNSDEEVIKKLNLLKRVGVPNEELDQKILELQLHRPNIDKEFFDQFFIEIGSKIAEDIFLSKLNSYKIEDQILFNIDSSTEDQDVKEKVLEFYHSNQTYLRVVVQQNYLEDDYQNNVVEFFKNHLGIKLLIHSTDGYDYIQEVTNSALVSDLLDEIAWFKRKNIDRVANEVTQLLYSDDVYIQRLAIVTLADLEYEAAWSDVVNFLFDENLLLVKAAIEFLESLEVQDAIQDLERISEDHWYSSIRFLATEAIKNIKLVESESDEKLIEEIIVGGNRRKGFITFDVEQCENFLAKKKIEDPSQKLYEENAKEKLDELSFEIEKSWYLDTNLESAQERLKELESRKTTKTKLIDDTSIVEVQEVLIQKPYIAHKHKEGWLLLPGPHRQGGGGLTFLNNKADVIRVLDEKIMDVFMIDNSYFAITNPGRGSRSLVYKLSYEDKQWKPEEWFLIPDSIKSAWLTTDDEIFMETKEDGVGIVLPQNREFRMAECAKQ